MSEPKFGGSTNDSWNDFESLFTSIVEVTNIEAARRIGYLKLHLTGQALQFFNTLPDATKADPTQTLAALRKQLCNPNPTALHMINLENMKFNSKTETPEESDDDLQKRQEFAVLERSNLVKRLFLRAIPKTVRMKLVEEEEVATVNDLCTKARRQLIFMDLYADDDVRDSFNEVSSQDPLTTKLVDAIRNLQKIQQ